MARGNKQIMAYMKLSNYILHCASTAILSHVPSYNPIPVFNSEYCYTAPARINLFSWIPDALEKRVNYHAIFAGSLAHSSRTHFLAWRPTQAAAAPWTPEREKLNKSCQKLRPCFSSCNSDKEEQGTRLNSCMAPTQGAGWERPGQEGLAQGR